MANVTYDALTKAHPIAVLTKGNDFKNYNLNEVYKALTKKAIVVYFLLNLEKLNDFCIHVFCISS